MMLKRWRNLSLGGRLTTLSVGLLAVLMGAFGGILYLNLRKFLLESTALRMRAQAKPIIEQHVNQRYLSLQDDAQHLSQALTSRDTTATIFNQNGDLLADGRRLPEEPAAAASRLDFLMRAVKGEKNITYPRLSRQQHALVALIPVKSTPNSAEVLGVVQLTTLLTQVDQILSRQSRVIGTGVLLAIGLGILGEMWLTRSALAPLKQVINTIHRMADGDLKQRVQLPHSHDEVGQLAVSFDEMASNLEATFASQSRFVSSAAHELRTPLTALQGSLEVLQRGSQDDQAAMRSLLTGMHREVIRLNHLTEQLLALTRFDAPVALNLKSVDLANFMDEVTQKAKYLAGERTIKRVGDTDRMLQIDAELFMQAFLDLIDNAIQHTDVHGVLELGWSVEDQFARLWLADDGEGIASDDLPHIFEPFYRGDRSRSRRQGGTGLGLAIVQAIVEAHGGKIEVVSNPDEGARFTIVLPVKPD
jgi:two-component system, OmpR family, sensor kinase